MWRPTGWLRLLAAGSLLLSAAQGAEIAAPRARVIVNPGPEYADTARTWQGIPGIERSPGGRLWVTWYSGGPYEGHEDNYTLVATSGDDGQSWSPPWW